MTIIGGINTDFVVAEGRREETARQREQREYHRRWMAEHRAAARVRPSRDKWAERMKAMEHSEDIEGLAIARTIEAVLAIGGRRHGN